MLSIYINLLFISCQADGRWTRKNRYDLSHFLSVPLNLWKIFLGCLKRYQWKKNIHTFVLFFCHLILTLIAHGMIMKLHALIICLVASLFVADTIFFIVFNLSKTRYTLLPGIKIIYKLLCCNQVTLLIFFFMREFFLIHIQ